MGSLLSFKKDPRVDIYIEVANPMYTPGEQVEGNVYLNVREAINYGDLRVRLEGSEQCRWTDGIGSS